MGMEEASRAFLFKNYLVISSYVQLDTTRKGGEYRYEE